MGDHSYDWYRFWVNFVVGAIIGASLGAISWVSSWYQGMSPFLWIFGWGSVRALAGGVCGDRFWEWLLRALRWW